jgi:hypothetical protein
MTATFILHTNILTTGDTNSFGTLNAYRTVATWTNIDLVTIIGEVMFKKYNRFNITLVIGEVEHIDSLSTIIAEKSLSINLFGLNFNNKTTTYATIGYINTITAGNGNFTVPNLTNSNSNYSIFDIKNPITFDKASRFVDLTISINKISDNLVVPTSGVNTGKFPQSCYIFRIDPITE